MEPVNLSEFESIARERLSEMAYAYFSGAAGDLVTLRANREAYARIALRPRVLVDVGRRSTATTVLGRSAALPVLVAPMAFQRLAHPDGELATARAAAAAGVPMVVSSLATTDVEEIVEAARPSPVWLQLYVFKDRGATRALVERAEAAGCVAVALTVDAPILGRREGEVRTRFHLPDGVYVRNLAGFGRGVLPSETTGSALKTYFEANLDPSLTWRDVEWLRGITRMPVVLKGVVRADDARQCVAAGAAAIVVSNHGGRQLDGAVATIDALPEVVEAAGGALEVYVDGGVRRGVDVVRALALGARAVLLGRPVLWGLAADGERGVRRVFELLAAEIDTAMALCGCREPGEIDRSLIFPGRAPSPPSRGALCPEE